VSRQSTRARAFYDVDGPFGLLSEPMPTPGSLASMTNILGWSPAVPVELRSALQSLTRLALRMPGLCANAGPFSQVCATALEDLQTLDAAMDEQVLGSLAESDRERAYSLMAHLAAGCTGTGGSIPLKLERACHALAKSLGRPQALSTIPQFPELVLSNWYFTEVEDGGVGTNNVHVALRFLACVDEDWYRRIHISLHARAAQLMLAIRQGQYAMGAQNDQGVIRSLQDISAWLLDCCKFLDAEFESKDSQSESLMMSRLIKFVAPNMIGDDAHAGYVWVYSMGSSVLLPALHAVLGVLPVQPRVLQFWAEMREAMPKQHQQLLRELEHRGNNMRRYCFTRFASRRIAVEKLYDLELAYNEALYALMRFCARRFRLVVRNFPDAERHSTLHDAQEEVIKRSRLHLLTMWMDVRSSWGESLSRDAKR